MLFSNHEQAGKISELAGLPGEGAKVLKGIDALTEQPSAAGGVRSL